MEYGRGKPTVDTLDNPTLPKRLGKYTYILAETRPPNRPGRVCKCGTVLSIYTSGRLCNACRRKRIGLDKL